MLYPFDREHGNGSNSTGDDWLDNTSIFDNEWGSSAATTFNPSEDDANGHAIPQRKQDRLDRLYSWHNGKGESDRKETIRASHVRNDAKTFMSVLEMPSYQRETVLNILQNLDIGSTNFGAGRPYEHIILAICSLISDEALSNRPNPDLDDRLFMQRSFKQLMDVNDMSERDHRKLRVAVREKSDYFD